jgi:carbon storage regulator
MLSRIVINPDRRGRPNSFRAAPGTYRSHAMLILSRFKDERIVIGDDIIITIIDIRGDKCKVGISAPKDMPVDRYEIAQAKARQRAKGSDDPDDPLVTEPA